MHDSRNPSRLDRVNQLLVLAARTRLGEKERQSARDLIGQPLDWSVLVGRARRHGLSPLLHRTLSSLGTEGVPAVHREALAADYYECLAANMNILDLLGSTLCRLQSAGVPVVVLKGAALLESVYGDIGLRPMVDADILVDAKDLGTTVGVLEHLGFALPPGLLSLEHYRRFHFQIPYHHARRNVVLEIHWDLQEPFATPRPDLRAIRSAAVPATVAGIDTRVMSEDDLIIYLCSHLSRHGYYNRFLLKRKENAASLLLEYPAVNQMIRFCDLWEILRSVSRFSWSDVLVKARAWGLEADTYTTFFLLHALYGTPIAQPLLDAVEAPKPRWHDALAFRLSTRRDHGRGRPAQWLVGKMLRHNRLLQFRPIQVLRVLDHLSPPPGSNHGRHSAFGFLSHAGHVIRTSFRLLGVATALALPVTRSLFHSGLGSVAESEGSAESRHGR